jgi:Transglycosylase-like domain/LysM domain
LGRHSKPSRIRLPQAAPSAAAAATLASVAAASLLSQQVPALASAAPAAPAAPGAPRSAVLDAAYAPAMTTAQLVSATRQAMLGTMQRARQATPASAQSATYTVRTGDSLSAIAGRVYRNPNAWPVLYWANHGQIQWADDIRTGQVLRVPAEPATIPAAPAQLAPPAPRHASTTPVVAQSAAPASAPAAAPAPAPASEPTGSLSGPWPGGAFGNCVVERESGGNPQVMNASGHYGLYQFSFSTWVAYGGNPADFGHASVAEQEQVFLNAMATPGGANNWAPYDGC